LFSTYITLFVDFHFLNEAVDKGRRYYLPLRLPPPYAPPAHFPQKGGNPLLDGGEKTEH
jgi:hypothetical protein